MLGRCMIIRVDVNGRSNNDEVVMIKMLVLQSWHGLSDPELERQSNGPYFF